MNGLWTAWFDVLVLLHSFTRLQGDEHVPACRSPREDVRHFKKKSSTEITLQFQNCSLHDKNFIPIGQNNEDLKIFKRFFSVDPLMLGQKKGFFVEMGALDGLKMSNSLLFEQCLGWDGLLIEANPKNFIDLTKNRPCASRVWAAMCPRHHQSHTFVSNREGTSKIVSNDIFVPSYKAQMVPCRTLASIFSDHEVKHIDFFSLDIEGAELYAVQSIDFSRVSISVMIIETNELKKDHSTQSKFKISEIHKILTKAGMVKVPNVGANIPECQRRHKNMTEGQFNLWGSEIYVHQSLRDDVC